jgi:hypothetical protein
MSKHEVANLLFSEYLQECLATELSGNPLAKQNLRSLNHRRNAESKIIKSHKNYNMVNKKYDYIRKHIPRYFITLVT